VQALKLFPSYDCYCLLDQWLLDGEQEPRIIFHSNSFLIANVEFSFRDEDKDENFPEYRYSRKSLALGTSNQPKPTQ